MRFSFIDINHIIVTICYIRIFFQQSVETSTDTLKMFATNRYSNSRFTYHRIANPLVLPSQSQQIQALQPMLQRAFRGLAQISPNAQYRAGRFAPHSPSHVCGMGPSPAQAARRRPCPDTPCSACDFWSSNGWCVALRRCFPQASVHRHQGHGCRRQPCGTAPRLYSRLSRSCWRMLWYRFSCPEASAHQGPRGNDPRSNI